MNEWLVHCRKIYYIFISWHSDVYGRVSLIRNLKIKNLSETDSDRYIKNEPIWDWEYIHY